MAKSITKNYIYNLVYQILILILPLITIPYLSRILGPENIGVYGYTLSIVTYFVLFGALGTSIYGQREIAYVQGDVEKRSKVFFEIMIFKFFTMLISSTIFYFTFANHGEYSIYYKILMIELLSGVIDVVWFFQGMEEFKKVIVRNLIIKILSIFAIFIFVKTQNDLIKYIFIYTFSNIAGNVSLWLYLPKYIKKMDLKKLYIMRHLKPTLALFIPQVAIQVYVLLDRTMLGLLTNNMNEVGYYEQSQKIVKVFLTVVTALGVVMIPRIANEFANKNTQKILMYIEKSFKFVYLLAFPILFGLIATAEDFVPLFLGEEFKNSIILVQISSFILLFIGMSNVIGTQFLIPTKRQREFTISVTVAAITNFILNLIFIPIWHSVGAVVATVIAELMVTLVQMYLVRKDMNIRNIIINMKKYFIASFVMFLLVYCLKDITTNPLYNIIIQVGVGGLTYFGLLFLLKEELVIEGKNKILNRVFNGGKI